MEGESDMNPALPMEHHHRNLQGGGPRAAVFGVSDGLVTNVSLILGVAGAHPGGGVVRLVGLAGLVAGAFSMAAGELVSMQTQRELLQRELEVERQALRQSPKGESDELAAIYERRGLDPGLAREVVDDVMSDPERALDAHAREELGINPDELGSPWQSAIASFIGFSIGALLPLLPWLFTSGNGAIWATVVIGAAAAAGVGALVGIFTERSVFRAALRQLLIATVAAGVTYGIGRLVGVSGVA